MCIGNVRNFNVGVWVCLTTFIIVAIAGIIRVVLILVFVAIELTGMVSMVTWFFAVVASWFGYLCVFSCGLLRHSFYLQLIWSFQSIQIRFFFKMLHNLFICVFLQMRLTKRFFHLGRHFGIYELLNVAWAATPNASFASLWSSFRNSNYFWFAGLETIRWNLFFAIAIDCGFTYFLRNTVKYLPNSL